MAEKVVVNLRTPYCGEVKALCILDATEMLSLGTWKEREAPRILTCLLYEVEERLVPTLVEFSTRYAETVPLPEVNAETVSQVLVDIHNRLDVLEEVLRAQ
ncbi:hypothetical protein PoB_006592100 [Plakobranchus ocellatus]|uniref:Uncharacterized protein n=1 Tax=Plakobranchus ocellatus TaxID=259542 RepID=A0AAV4D5I3_9GAST|nr:hypothetical protein PoB_006592100 [Plakobranchus ocellatus]